MTKFLTDIVRIEEMGVNKGGDRGRVEEYVQLTCGDEFELGLDVDGGYEITDSTGEVVAYIFLVPMEEAVA